MVVLVGLFLDPLNIYGGAMIYFGLSSVAFSCKICVLFERPGGVMNILNRGLLELGISPIGVYGIKGRFISALLLVIPKEITPRG